MTTDEADIRRRIDGLVNAIRAMDLEGALPVYAPGIVSFDIVPPLRHFGVEGKRKQWEEAFAMFQPPLGYEIRDLAVAVGDEVAFSHCLARMSGKLKNGQQPRAFWVRWTAGFRKVGGDWLIVHDQISVPADVASGRALLDLGP